MLEPWAVGCRWMPGKTVKLGTQVRDQSGPRDLEVKLEFLPCNTILIP